MFFLHSAIQVK